jgi:hypothetical protein
MRLDRPAGIVDPTVRPRFLDHGGKIPLPIGIVLDAWPAAQCRLEDPGGVGVGQLRRAGNRTANLVEPRAVGFDDELEGAKIVAVFESEVTGGGEFQEQRVLAFFAIRRGRSRRPRRLRCRRRAAIRPHSRPAR